MKTTQVKEPHFITEKRKEAAEKLNWTGSAIYRYGLNIVTNFDVDIEKAKPECIRRVLVNQNGKAEALQLMEADDATSEGNFMKTIELNDRLVALNTALLNSGIALRLPAGTDCGTIHLKLEGSGKDFSHILVIAEKGSSATIIEEASGKSEYRGCVAEVIAHEDSQVRYGTVQKLEGGINYNYRKATAFRNALVEWLEITTGSDTMKSETHTELIGEGSRTTMLTAFFGEKGQQFDYLNRCNHTGRNTESMMLCSGALKGKSRAIQQGFAKIGKKAYGATAHQKSKILLLDEGAKAIPIPKLEIDNNDVAATHEAGVGQIDREKIFYMMSRGITEKEAKKAYVEGFFEQYTAGLEIPEIKESISRIIEERMEND